MGRPKKKQPADAAGHQEKKEQASAARQAALEETRKELAGGKTTDLFGDDADAEAVKGSGFSFKLNQEYARDYEAEKQRKEFESLRARHEIEEDSSEDTEEDEDGVLLDPASDLRIHEALLAIKRGEKDAAAAQISSVNTTVKSHLDSILKGKESIADSKKYTLKDYMRDALTTKTAEQIADLEKDEEEALAKKARDAMTPKEEEEAARQAFLKATEEDTGDYVVQKKESRDAKIDRMLDRVQVAPDRMTLAEKESKVNAQLAQLFQDADTSDKNEMFLRNYFLNQGWQKEQESDDDESLNDEDLKDEMDAEMEDDEFDEAQKKFEKEYREVEHHHMEEGASEIIAHPRGHLIKDTLRKETNPRKEARLRKKEREAQEKIRRDEGVKRLKHLKRQQMDEKIQQIEAIAGKAPEDLLDLAEFDEDFDPDTWDAKMDKVFNQDFYEADDDSFDPSELGSDDDLSLSSDDSSSDSSDSEDRAAREAKRQKQISQSAAKKAGKKGGAPAEAEEEDEAEAAAAEAPSKKKKAKKESVTALTAEEKKELQKKKRQILKQMEEEVEREIEEYNKLDYEGVVAGQKVRFKYKSVPAETFGLTDDDIFTIDDRNLNSIAPLKFYAPYRSKQDNMRDRYIAQENRKNVHIDPEAGPARKSGKYRSGLAPVEFVKNEEVAPADGGEEAKEKKSKKKKKGQAKEEGAAAASAPAAAAPAADADAKAAKKKKEKRPREEAEGAAAAAATAPPAAKKIKKEKKEKKQKK